jgi:D-methionine transport system ATP-binding protein
MIEFRNISKTFRHNGVETVALSDINFTVAQGEIYGIIGYSGAGKSTLVRMINFLERPTSGDVLVRGVSLGGASTAELRSMRRKIGMIFQHFNLLESRTVFDNVAIPLVLTNVKKSEIKRRVEELLAFVGLEDKAAHYPSELSGGQKQRVGIARALANNPDILLCDEATSALDPQTTDSILQLLKQINRQYRITIIFITHEMHVIQSICDKVAVMEQGRVIENGDVLAVFGHPQQHTTQNFVRSVINDTIPDGVVGRLNDHRYYRLFKLEFLDRSASEPVINELILQARVTVNILFAHMSEIHGVILGSMFIQIQGESADIDDAGEFLRSRGVRVTEVAN